MVREFSLRVLAASTMAALSCSAALGQQTIQAPAPGQSAPPSQLPDSPVPKAATTANQPFQALQSASSSSDEHVKPLFWTNPDPNAQVTVLEDTLLRVMSNQPVSTRETRAGASLSFTLREDVVVDNVLIIPRGATVHGTVVESRHAGTLTGSPDLILQLTSLDLGGRSYPLYTYQFKAVGESKTKPTEAKVRGGAVIGAVVGGIFDGSAKGNPSAVSKLAGMGTGAALGAGTGTLISAATPGPILSIPAESQLDFYLSSPISVVPVSEKEAARLSEGLRAGGPVLYVRGETP